MLQTKYISDNISQIYEVDNVSVCSKEYGIFANFAINLCH